jgi:hypothetical protein
MTIKLSDIKTSGEIKPPRVIIYGVQGIGKSTFAAGVEAPIFIQTEDGIDAIPGIPSFNLTNGTYDDIMDAISVLYTEKHDYRTFVLDSLDWLEPKIWQKVCDENELKSIEKAGYGKGYVMALALWRDYIDGINALRNDRGMCIVQIAHAHVRRFESPQHDPYDRYEMKLHAKAAALVQEHSDAVLFANYDVSLVRGGDEKRKTARAVGNGTRYLFTEERPAFVAKNRYQLPERLAFPMHGAWNVFENNITTARESSLAQAKG